jgi:hypothetical protein
MLTQNTNSSSAANQSDNDEFVVTDVGTAGYHVELWYEPVHTGGKNLFDRVVERLRDLSERGYVDSVSVGTWDRYVEVFGDDPESDVPKRVLNRLERLERWQRLRGDESSTTDPRIVGRGRLGPSFDARRVPRAALIEFEDGVVTHVTLADERIGCLTERLKQIAECEPSEADTPNDDATTTRE